MLPLVGEHCMVSVARINDRRKPEITWTFNHHNNYQYL